MDQIHTTTYHEIYVYALNFALLTHCLEGGCASVRSLHARTPETVAFRLSPDIGHTLYARKHMHIQTHGRVASYAHQRLCLSASRLTWWTAVALRVSRALWGGAVRSRSACCAVQRRRCYRWGGVLLVFIVALRMHGVGQNHIYTTYMNVYLLGSLHRVPDIYTVYRTFPISARLNIVFCPAGWVR